jgi:hypothetical protein
LIEPRPRGSARASSLDPFLPPLAVFLLVLRTRLGFPDHGVARSLASGGLVVIGVDVDVFRHMRLAGYSSK